MGQRIEREAPLWTAQVLTLLPEAFPGLLGLSLAGRGLRNGIWNLEVFDIRQFAEDRHRTVDDTPFGGGPGMVLRPDVLARALDAANAGAKLPRRVVCLSPRGKPLDQAFVRSLAQAACVTLICGRFEGIDQRLIEARAIEEVSLGDFVLSGGEAAALALIDAVVRLLPGVIGDADGLAEESFADDLLEYPQYTRPQVWEERPVPEVLLSGHHDEIRRWRQARAEEITQERRPDLWRRHLARSKTGAKT
jgi:tRNA (guanine37-N1)-methyltransferase